MIVSSISSSFGEGAHIDTTLLGSGKLKQMFPGCQSAISVLGGGAADIKFSDGDVLQLGARKIYIAATPGHTPVRLQCLVWNVVRGANPCFSVSSGLHIVHSGRSIDGVHR